MGGTPPARGGSLEWLRRGTYTRAEGCWTFAGKGSYLGLSPDPSDHVAILLPAFLNLGPVGISSGGCPVRSGVFGSILGLCPLDMPVSPSTLAVMTQNIPRQAECPLWAALPQWRILSYIQHSAKWFPILATPKNYQKRAFLKHVSSQAPPSTD